MNALKVAGEDLQHAIPVSPEIMTQRLVKFLKDNKDQINQEQVHLISRVAQKAQLIGNADHARDFKKLGNLINKLSARLISLEPKRNELPIPSDLTVKSWGLKSFKLNSLFSAKGIIGTVAAVALTVFIGYTISNYVDRIQLKNALKSGFKNELSTFDLGVNFENHSGKSLVRNCYGRKYSTVNYDFSPLLGVNDQELEGNIQNYFKDIDNVIDNKFAHSLSYKFFAAKAPNQSKFGLVMEGC